MTLKDFIASLPQDRRDRAKVDPTEREAIAAEYNRAAGTSSEPGAQVESVPDNSFDISDVDSARRFAAGMKRSHPWLADKVRNPGTREAGWQEMLEIDRKFNARFKASGGQVVLSDEDTEEDREYFKWAATQGKLPEATLGSMTSAFLQGVVGLAKGAVSLAGHAVQANVKAMTLQKPTGDRDVISLGATAVEGAQQMVSEYKQLGAGAAGLVAKMFDNPEMALEAKYQVARYAQAESKRQGEWRRAISEKLAAAKVDENEVELASEIFDVDNLVGFGLGRLVTKNPGVIGDVVAKTPVIGRTPRKAVLAGQVDALSKEATAVNGAVIELENAVAAARRTIDENPNVPLAVKEKNLRTLEAAKADLARVKGDALKVDQQLTEARTNFSKILDAEGLTLTDTAVGGGLRAAGATVGGVLNLAERARNIVGTAVAGNPDILPDLVGGPIKQLNRLASDSKVLGELWSQGSTTIPFYRRVAASDQVTGLTKAIAFGLDRSGLGWAASGAFDLARAGAVGAPVSGAFGYVASGGDLNAAAESAGFGASAGISGGAYGAWEVYRSPEFRAAEMQANRRAFKSVLSQREVGGVSQSRLFDQLSEGDQLAIATYAQANPDVQFRFERTDGVSGYYDRENNMVVLNPDSKTPLRDIFRHEVAHFAERHGLTAPVRNLYLGNAETGQIGEFTKLDESGKPVVVETANADGSVTRRHVLNAEGQALKDEYDAKMRRSDPSWTSTDEYFASELFAEQYAQRLFDGGLKRDLRNSPVDALMSRALVKDFMGKIGLMFDRNDRIIGTGIFSRQKRNTVVEKLISEHNKKVARGADTELVDDEQYLFTEEDLRNPEIAVKWANGGGRVKFDADGKPVYKNGNLQYLTEKEAEAQARDFTNELIVQIEKYAAENPDSDVLQRREIDTMSGKRVVYSGRIIPAPVLDALAAQKRFNPHQIAHLRAMAASVEQYGSGAMISHFYQAATRKATGKAYKSVAGRQRRDGVLGFRITKDANVVIDSISWEQLFENIERVSKTKLARDTWALAGGDLQTAMLADVRKYLDNVIAGRPGETDIGTAKRDFINNQFGLRMASNEGANPLASETRAPKVVYTALRLDRMNRVAPLNQVEVPWGHDAYERVKQNLRPESKARTLGENAEFVKDPVYGDPKDFKYRPETGHPGRLTSDNVPKKKDVDAFIAEQGLTEAEAEAYRAVVEDVRSADKTALPLNPQYDAGGRPKFETEDDVTTLKVSPIRYDFIEAPEVRKIRDRYEREHENKLAALEAKLKAPGADKAKIKAAIAETKEAWKAGGRFRWRDEATTLLGDRLYEEARGAMNEPSVQAGIGWYSKMRSWLQNRFGAGIEVFSQLLGATSARTPVDENFKQALDAIRRLSRGDYDALLQRYDDHIAPIRAQLAKGEIDEDAARKKINEFSELPTRSNGKKFNANSQKVLQALYGNWLELTQGPKTPNFAGNLSGRTLKATIDVWAARTARRLLYQNRNYNPETGRVTTAENRWRILPEAETGVEFSRIIGTEIGGDFGFAQEAFQKAADKLGMEADDLQALLWFHEKHVWDVNGWTKAAGKVKSSFESEAGKLDTERFQLGVTTFTNPDEFSPEAFAQELTATRDRIAESSDTVYARVTPSQGLYGGTVEPSFDAEFVMHRGADVTPVLAHIVSLGKRYNQYDVFLSKIVSPDHPNARPGLEIGFKAALDQPFVDKLTAALRAGGIDGFTVARDRRGRPIGVRSQFIPEITARWVDDKSAALSRDQVENASRTWAENARTALKSLPQEIREQLSYEQETFFDTRVVGREEYDRTPDARAETSLGAELGRRRAALGLDQDGPGVLRGRGDQPRGPGGDAGGPPAAPGDGSQPPRVGGRRVVHEYDSEGRIVSSRVVED